MARLSRSRSFAWAPSVSHLLRGAKTCCYSKKEGEGVEEEGGGEKIEDRGEKMEACMSIFRPCHRRVSVPVLSNGELQFGCC